MSSTFSCASKTFELLLYLILLVWCLFLLELRDTLSFLCRGLGWRYKWADSAGAPRPHPGYGPAHGATFLMSLTSLVPKHSFLLDLGLPLVCWLLRQHHCEIVELIFICLHWAWLLHQQHEHGVVLFKPMSLDIQGHSTVGWQVVGNFNLEYLIQGRDGGPVWWSPWWGESYWAMCRIRPRKAGSVFTMCTEAPSWGGSLGWQTAKGPSWCAPSALHPTRNLGPPSLGLDTVLHVM